jgi:hypothetical protein
LILKNLNEKSAIIDDDEEEEPEIEAEKAVPAEEAKVETSD